MATRKKVIKTPPSGIPKNSQPSKELPIRLPEFEIPEGFLQQLGEFTAGGFILITGDNSGKPRIYSRYDSMLQALGLITFGAEFLKNQSIAAAQAIRSFG